MITRTTPSPKLVEKTVRERGSGGEGAPTRALLEAVQRYFDSIIKNPKSGELYTNA